MVPEAWKTELVWLAGIAMLTLVADALSGYAWPVLSLGLAFYTGRQLHHLTRLASALRTRRRIEPPYPNGLWRQIYQQIRHLQTGSQRRKRRLARFITRFRKAATALPDAVVILGSHGEVDWANPAAGDLLGVPWPQGNGRLLTALVDHPVLTEYVQVRDYRRPLELHSPVNKTVVLSIHVTPFGKKRQRLVVARDITRVYHLDQVRTDFVSNVSHELRTPLTVISGFLESLADSGEECAQWSRSVELMQQQAARMQRIIEDLLILSRLEMEEEEVTLETTPVPVPRLLASIVEEARSLSGDAGHVISLEADPALWLQANTHELRSAFSNLIFNAVRHTPGHTEIHVLWEANEQGAYLSVRDSGEGIPALHIPRLTERFYRIDKGRSRESGGTGLGLAIVKHALNRYGGELQIASEVGRGSTFTCRFPNDVLAMPQDADEPEA